MNRLGSQYSITAVMPEKRMVPSTTVMSSMFTPFVIEFVIVGPVVVSVNQQSGVDTKKSVEGLAVLGAKPAPEDLVLSALSCLPLSETLNIVAGMVPPIAIPGVAEQTKDMAIFLATRKPG